MLRQWQNNQGNLKLKDRRRSPLFSSCDNCSPHPKSTHKRHLYLIHHRTCFVTFLLPPSIQQISTYDHKNYTCFLVHLDVFCTLRLLQVHLGFTALPVFMSIYISKLLPLSLLCTTISATCYYPDGSPITPDNHPPNVNSTDYQPCDSDTSSFSMCCATNRLVKGDTCMSNGICHNGYGEYWRESCTDPTWNSPFCLKNICANASVSLEKPKVD